MQEMRFQDAFNRHDLDSIVALYEADAVLARSDGPVRGTDAIREAYRLLSRHASDHRRADAGREPCRRSRHAAREMELACDRAGWRPNPHGGPEYRNRSPAAGWTPAFRDRQSL